MMGRAANGGSVANYQFIPPKPSQLLNPGVTHQTNIGASRTTNDVYVPAVSITLHASKLHAIFDAKFTRYNTTLFLLLLEYSAVTAAASTGSAGVGHI